MDAGAPEPLRFYDTTLRDGLRNSGVEMDLDARLSVAGALADAGVDAIEVGYGGPDQVPVMQALAGRLDRRDGPVAYGLSRVRLRDLDRVLAGVGPAARTGASIYLPCSDRFLAAAGTDRREGSARLVRAIEHARPHVDEVVFATQDASRADVAFLTDLCAAAIDAGADAVSVSDTVSHARPAEFAALCATLRAAVPVPGVTWSAHCHEELGLGIENCLAAIGAGVRQVEGTLGGIGEGAGNTAIDGVARAVVARPDARAAVTVAVDVDALTRAAALVPRPA